MLKLEKMQLVGFKSFMDKTEVIFPDGITAVVGPNGCGKSNIGDAISWVLGEQSVKSLRGIKMEDVIFNGSESKKPLGMAEVSLRFLSKNGSGDNGADEIILTRRLFRSGESEYVLNGEKCRLKDIKNLLSQVHIGVKTCAVIEQGRVEEIMNAKPIERRILIEEAAGILGYKGKRKLAETKLEATKANLLRVQDIIAEVERQMNSLRRQASKARRFTRLSEAKRQKQAQLFIVRHSRLDADISKLDSALADLKMKEAQLLSQLGVLEATIERSKQEIVEKEDLLSANTEKSHLLDKELSALEAKILSSEEKISELGAAVAKAAQERESFNALMETMEEEMVEKVRERVVYESEKFEMSDRIKQMESSLKELNEKESLLHLTLEEGRESLVMIAQSLAEIRNDLKLQESELGKTDIALDRKRREASEESERILLLKKDLSAHEEKIQSKEKEHMALVSRIDALRAGRMILEADVKQREESVSSKTVLLNSLQEKEKFYQSPEVAYRGIDRGTQTILQNDERFAVRHKGIVADWIKTGNEYERAVEGYIGGVLPALFVHDLGSAVEAMKLLKAADAGAGRFLFPSAKRREERKTGIPEEIKNSRHFIGRLSEKVEFTDGMKDIIGAALDNCIVMADIDAIRVFCEAYPEIDYVTLDGEVVRNGSFAETRSAGEEGQGILSRKRTLEAVRQEIALVGEELAADRVDASGARERLRSMGDEESAVQDSIRKIEEEMLSIRHEAMRASELIQQSGKKVSVLNDEMSIAGEERAAMVLRVEKLREEISVSERDQAQREGKIRELKAELEMVKESLARANAGFSAVYSEYAEKGEQLAALDAELVHIRESREETSRKIEGSLKNETDWKQTICHLQGEIEGSRKSAEQLVLERKELHDRVESLKRDIVSMKESIGAVESEIKKVRADTEALKEEMKEKELSRAGIHSDMKHNSEVCNNELGKSVGELLSSTAPDPEANEEILLRQLADLNETIQRVGPINMMAMEEFDQLEERFKFLSTQRKDLTDSMESLNETIRKINRTSREKFFKAFEEVRENFNKTFKILFGGGKADLRLEEGDDILESGLDIIAQPPGKRLQNINLLSGGEKALTAIALLFAVFRYQPSPFCLLDEADAPLDDMNVGRYLDMLREYSDKTQFILITHNKKTMEVANLLYGVTMEEPGISKVVSLKLN